MNNGKIICQKCGNEILTGKHCIDCIIEFYNSHFPHDKIKVSK
jgi:hypothetical protein